MKKILLIVIALLCWSPFACAQGGCVNSPENPTALLAVVGAAAAAFTRRRRKR
jgi:MYXO-CTERM domain-containing protein